MRDELDAILDFVGASSLTDEEFALLTLDDNSTDLENYNALLGVLETRETASPTRDRLKYYYLAMAVEIPDGEVMDQPAEGHSDVFLGAPLTDETETSPDGKTNLMVGLVLCE